jgi:multisubunit Na+/H+ antiporter MnhG subunit
MAPKGPANPERSFGLSVGAVLCAISLALVWRGRVHRAEVLGTIGGLLVILGVLRPALLGWPSAWWWRFSRALGRVNARVLLTLLFVVVLTPVGLIWRLMGRDPLARRRGGSSGWSLYPVRYRDRQHYLRMF